MHTKQRYIGLMSGTSIDGIDAGLVEFDGDNCRLIARHLHPIPQDMEASLHQLCSNGANEIEAIAEADIKLGRLFAQASLALLAKTSYSTRDITAIGSHGQTIRHIPQASYTLQIGDPNTIATLTNIDTVADFRRKDMALGGQGAPLVPAFHQAVFQHPSLSRCIVNIGGLANVTYLPTSADDIQSGTGISGYDTGPGNTLLDAWYKQHHGDSYDKDGKWAASGQVIPALLARLLAHPYFSQPLPKSTGRETFHLAWLNEQLSAERLTENNSGVRTADIQRTLLQFTAASIANEIKALMPSSEVYICGGGASNPVLMAALTQELTGYPIATTAALGIDPDWVEAIAFAWLAKQFIDNKPGNLPAVTGASRPAILGGLYPAN